MFSHTVVTTAIATVLALGPTAANARPAAPVATPTTSVSTIVAAGAGGGSRSTADSPEQVYCVVSDVTGSRIRHRQCETLADWQAMDVDPRTMRRVR